MSSRAVTRKETGGEETLKGSAAEDISTRWFSFWRGRNIYITQITFTYSSDLKGGWP